MPSPTMQIAQTSPAKTVSRLRFFSTTELPDSCEDTAPPNIDDRPPPLPRCSRMSTISSTLVSTSSTLRTSSIIVSLLSACPRVWTRTRWAGARLPSLTDAPDRPVQTTVSDGQLLRRSADPGGGDVVAAVGLQDDAVAQSLAGQQLDAVLRQRHVGRGLLGRGEHLAPGVGRDRRLGRRPSRVDQPVHTRVVEPGVVGVADVPDRPPVDQRHEE